MVTGSCPGRPNPCQRSEHPALSFFSDRLSHLQCVPPCIIPIPRSIVWHQTVVPGGPQIITMYHLAKGLYLLATSKEGSQLSITSKQHLPNKSMAPVPTAS